MMDSVLFHADDFGANEEISQHIIDCHVNGALNSLSVLFNSPRVDACMKMLEPYRKDVHVSIHLNLAEGPCAANPKDVPLLTDERGMLTTSFFGIFLISLLPKVSKKRKEWKRQIQIEMAAQIKKALPYITELRLDSHQHYHMIPMVLEAILDAVHEIVPNMEIAFLRIPAEPIGPFLKHPALYGTYKPINFVKNMVLNVCNLLSGKMLSPFRKKSAVFCGIMMSGGTDYKRVKILMPDFMRLAEKKGVPFEILAHPGGVLQKDHLLDTENANCVEFYLSNGRKIEKEMFLRMKDKKD